MSEDGLRVVSFGGGVQSTALLVLAAQDRIPHRTFLFANVGDDSEHPRTLAYLKDVSVPFAAEYGLALHQLQKTFRDGTVDTLHHRLTKPGSLAIGIPVRMSNGMPGKRACTVDFKIKVIGKWLKAHGASDDNPATVAIGFSTDEVMRCKGFNPKNPYEVPEYPLIQLGYSRQDCLRIISDAGLPQPPKSSCYFCPFHAPTEWERMAREEPDLIEKSIALEERMNAPRLERGKPPVWLTKFNRPLKEVIANRLAQGRLFDNDDGSCDDGYCFT